VGLRLVSTCSSTRRKSRVGTAVVANKQHGKFVREVNRMSNPARNPEKSLEYGGRTVGIELITPTEATAYLESMPGNRPLSNKQVEYLTQMAIAGKHHLFVSPIHFDTQGRLRNGQHRMWMVIELDKPVEFLVIRNASEEEVDALDTGKRRTGGDVLALDGYANGGLLAGALTNLWMYEYNIVPGNSRTFFATKNAPGLTNHMMREYMPLHPKLVDSVGYMRNTPSVRLLASPSILSFCHYIIVKSSPVEGANFWESIATQKFDGQNDPAYRLFDRLSRAKTGVGQAKKRNQLTNTEVAALTIKAWNFWVQGKSIGLLRWKGPDSPQPEEFPRLRNTRHKHLTS